MVKSYTLPKRIESFATLGPILRDEEGFEWGIVSKHVTSIVLKGSAIYTRETIGNIKIAAPLRHTNMQSDSYDIDIVKLNLTTKTEPMYENISGKHGDSFVYRNSVNELIGKTVFNRNQLNNQNSARTGQVCHPPCHILNGYFFVSSTKHCPFAEPSHSGGVVGMDDGSGNTLLIGVIVGGEFCLNEMAQDTNHDYTLCLSLSTGIEVLEHRYNRKFHLLKPNESSHIHGYIPVRPGMAIRFYRLVMPSEVQSERICYRGMEMNQSKEKQYNWFFWICLLVFLVANLLGYLNYM